MRSFLGPLAAVLALAGQLLASPVEAEALESESSPTPADVDIDADISLDDDSLSLNMTTDLALSSSLARRSGCNQSNCPDSRFGFDVLSNKLRWSEWFYFLRWWGTCGCQKVQIFKDGCKTFTICSGTHSVCMDWKQGRAHWVDPGGVKRCYTLTDEYLCDGKMWAAWPTGEVACTW
ncbi:uncharacterized protein BBA_06129 [Beauveria bassiana ARSEF 2860]|uniref:Secreted protein n=1 Tax=Beauveria bassiana (strain ARSEF 2860) TaxID=655819 RepID=J4KN23_BEAB2|nr:uncharacterized protein BBA_06129 [Beauveria bassiana ARSEF 2860]EJP64954.1 hypothetical protein BBA_06129 [Beauveria bassiana ARSEF 2860]